MFYYRESSRIPSIHDIGFPSWVCFHSIAGPSGLCNLSKLRRDSVGADFQSVRELTNYIYAAPPESRPKLTSEAQTKKSIADIGISAPSAKLI